MNKHIWHFLLLLGAFCVGCNQGGEVAPPNDLIGDIGREDTLVTPSEWGHDSCGVGASLAFGPISGQSSRGGFIWLGLMLDDNLVSFGGGDSVGAGNFSVPGLSLAVSDSQLQDRDYAVIAFLADSPEQVGVLSERRTASRPYFLHLSPKPSSFASCINVLQGDSVYLELEYDNGNYFITYNDYVSYSNCSWEIRWQKDSALADSCIPLLDPSGLIFPLMTTDANSAIGWFVQAKSPTGAVIAEAALHIEKPSKLGDVPNDFDDEIAWWANVNRVPVSLQKAIIWKESRLHSFDSASYRYEACKDAEWFSLSEKPTEYPYLKYNLQIPNTSYPGGPLARGHNLIVADTTPAVERYGGIEKLDSFPRDGFLTAAEYLMYTTRENWDCEVSTDVIAQTTLCASYGITQMMYYTAIFAKWNEDTSGVIRGGNPSRLFGLDLNINLSAKYLRRLYDDYTDPSKPWDERWRVAVGKYNAGQNGTPDTGYVNPVLAQTAYYHPQ